MRRINRLLFVLLLTAAAAARAETLDLASLQNAEEVSVIEETPWTYPLPYELLEGND